MNASLKNSGFYLDGNEEPQSSLKVLRRQEARLKQAAEMEDTCGHGRHRKLEPTGGPTNEREGTGLIYRGLVPSTELKSAK